MSGSCLFKKQTLFRFLDNGLLLSSLRSASGLPFGQCWGRHFHLLLLRATVHHPLPLSPLLEDVLERSRRPIPALRRARPQHRLGRLLHLLLRRQRLRHYALNSRRLSYHSSVATTGPLAPASSPLPLPLSWSLSWSLNWSPSPQASSQRQPCWFPSLPA